MVNRGPDLSLTEADLPLLGEHDLDEVHCRILTSGTSGAPRAVGLTYGNHLWSAVGSAFNLGLEPTDRWLCCLPLFHVGGLSILMRSVIYGTTAVVHEGFDVDRIATSLEGDGVTVISLVTTQLARLLEAGVDLLPLRAILVGGGPVPEEVLEEALGRGATVVQTYGLTEAASQVTTLAPQRGAERVGSAGRPLLTTHLRISDGEILVQGPTVAPGCRRRGRVAPHRRPRADRRGRLPLRRGPDRRRDRHRRRERAPDRGRGGPAAPPGRRRGRRGRPHRPGMAGGGHGRRRPARRRQASAEELRSHCAAELAGFKVPKQIEFADELPRTASGKLMRRELQWLMGACGCAAMTSTTTSPPGRSYDRDSDLGGALRRRGALSLPPRGG